MESNSGQGAGPSAGESTAVPVVMRARHGSKTEEKAQTECYCHKASSQNHSRASFVENEIESEKQFQLSLSCSLFRTGKHPERPQEIFTSVMYRSQEEVSCLKAKPIELFPL